MGTALACVLLLGCPAAESPPEKSATGAASSPSADGSPRPQPALPDAAVASRKEALPASSPHAEPSGEKRAFFGDLHVHSSWSFDAYAEGSRGGPRLAYQFARGEAIPHLSGSPVQLAGPPLDFMALTDHAEYLGLVVAIQLPEHPVKEQNLIKSWLSEEPALRKEAWRRIQQSFRDRKGYPALMTDATVGPAWRALIALANDQYKPGEFTSLIGFEYTPAPDGQNLHRNVLFRGDEAPPRPFSAMESGNPEDLWAWMDGLRDEFGDVLAIPHNSNGSNGLMFAQTRLDGSAIDDSWIDQRARNEPAVEVVQIKGQSETHPTLSPTDAWADFEVADWRTTRVNQPSQPTGSYARDALKSGLLLGEQTGRNPFAFGLVGGTDGHLGTSPFEERNFTGKIGVRDATPAGRLDWRGARSKEGEALPSVSIRWSAAGLTGIWAEENTRSALFDAIRRRETFATSGPRIRLRLMAGWDFTQEDLQAGLDRAGGGRGVPMGGVLAAADAAGDAMPRFLVQALQDPLDGPLERLQIVKGWTEDGKAHEQIFDIACAGGAVPDPVKHRCPTAAPPPNLETCETAPGVGAADLGAWWIDPTYDQETNAFYYARALQVPTCRWSTYDANRLGRSPPASVPASLQERAYSSPIWIGGNTALSASAIVPPTMSKD